MFNSIYSTSVTTAEFLIMAATAIVSGIVFAWIMSFKLDSSKRFLTVTALMPFVIAAVITFVNGNIGAGVAMGGAFSLIRFRSAQGTADELAAILISMGAGIAFGMGYLAYGVLIMICLSLVYLLLAALPVFKGIGAKKKLLRITIPESLEYTDVFEETFSHYLKSYESVGVKTTGMGSMYRLSFKICMKNDKEEKAFIDELRTKNGNLEIAVLPYSEEQIHL